MRIERGSARRRRRPAGAALACVALAMLAAAPSASAGTIGFESPALPAGTPVSDQFASQGITFTQGPPGGNDYLAEIVTSDARTGNRALDVSTGGVEFPTPALAGTFSRTRSQVSVYVRSLAGPGYSTPLRVEAFDASGTRVDSNREAFTYVLGSTAGYIELRAASPRTDIARFRLRAGLHTEGHEIRVDDVTFDDPPVAAPDFALSSSATGTIVVAQGAHQDIPIAISRINGSSGNIAMSLEAAESGLAGTFTPNPAGGNASSTTLRLDASATAPGEYVVHVVGQATEASAGPTGAARRLELRVRVIPPFRVHGAASIDLHPCSRRAATIHVIREAGVEEGVDLEVRPREGTLPAGITAEVAPSRVSGAGRQEAVLTLTRADTAPGPDVALLIRGRSENPARPVAEHEVMLRRVLPEIRDATSPGYAPMGVDSGSPVTFTGRGICPGATARFTGSPETVSMSSIEELPDGGTTGVARVPRLAIDGPVEVANPVSGAGISPRVSILGFRNFQGLPYASYPWMGGELRDWQELLGPRQTNFKLWFCPIEECAVVTPLEDPIFAIFRGIANAGLSGGHGTFGLALGTRRIAHQQVRLLNAESGATIHSLQMRGPERVRGRGDIPFEGARDYVLRRWFRFQHQAQLTAEAVHHMFARRIAHAGQSDPSRLRTALHTALRAGRRPLVAMSVIHDGRTYGHAVVAYGIEARPRGGGFYIHTWDPNIPFVAQENVDPAFHAERERLSRIVVDGNGGWSYPGLEIGGGAWRGPLDTIVSISAENEIPVVPTSLIGLDGLQTFVFGAGGHTAASASSAAGRPDRLVALPVLDHPAPLPILAGRSGVARRIGMRADDRGRARLGVFGDGSAASVEAAGVRAGAVTTPGGQPGIGFETAGRAARVALTATAEGARGARRLVRVEGVRGGAVAVRLDRRTGAVSLTRRGGRAGVVRLELAQWGGPAAPSRFSGRLRLGTGARVAIRPAWSRLGRRLRVKVGGRPRTVRGGTGEGVRVARLGLGVRRAGGSVLATVRARVTGARRAAGAAVLVEVRRSGRRVARATRWLAPSRLHELRRGARLPVSLPPALARARGLRVTARVAVVASRPLPVADRRQVTRRVADR